MGGPRVKERDSRLSEAIFSQRRYLTLRDLGRSYGTVMSLRDNNFSALATRLKFTTKMSIHDISFHEFYHIFIRLVSCGR